MTNIGAIIAGIKKNPKMITNETKFVSSIDRYMKCAFKRKIGDKGIPIYNNLKAFVAIFLYSIK